MEFSCRLSTMSFELGCIGVHSDPHETTKKCLTNMQYEICSVLIPTTKTALCQSEYRVWRIYVNCIVSAFIWSTVLEEWIDIHQKKRKMTSGRSHYWK